MKHTQEGHKENNGSAAAERQVQNLWKESTESEALALINLMKNNPSIAWREMMTKAEAHNINHWRLLLQNSDQIYESIAEAIANNDRLVTVQNGENENG